MASPFVEIRTADRSEWLDLRKTGVGGSEAAAVMGLSPYSSPLAVWLKKTGREAEEDISDKPAVYWGTVLEDVVAREFKARHPELKVRRKNATLRSKERPWALADIDRMVVDEHGRKGVLEIKTCSAYRASDWDDGVPEYYQPQPAHYLGVTGWDFAWVAVLIGGQDYREYYIERDDEDVAAVTAMVDEFWRYVAEDVAPAVTMGNASEADALYSMHAEDDGEWLHMADSDVPAATAYMVAAAAEKADKSEKELRRNELMEAIGDAKGIITPTLKIAWNRTAERNRGIRVTKLKG